MLAEEPSMAAGRDNAPETMLSTQGFEPAAAPVTSGLDFNLDFDARQTGTSGAPAEPSFDMSLDMGAGAAPPAGDSASGFDMDFNIGAPETSDSSSTMIDFDTSGTQELTTGLDFSTSGTSPSAGGDAEEFSLGGMGDSVAEMDGAPSAGAATEGGLPGWDETATKLDLAKAYIDMGDSEGARSILDEVIAEGNESQKQQAQSLVAQIAA
jgi:pilus assembly protein FimV